MDPTPSAAVASLPESVRIRTEWQKRNAASVYGSADDIPIRQAYVSKSISKTANAEEDILSAPQKFAEPEKTDNAESRSPVILVSSESAVDTPNPSESLLSVAPDTAGTDTGEPDVETFPVNLPTILQLAGGSNWAVQLAWERINQAKARVTAAESMWLPSLNIGIGATKHDGQIQGTSGQVFDVSRNSLFVGGGAKVGGAPLAGGAGGPARLAVDLSLADALYQPLVARQLSCAAQSRHAVEFNNAQLDGAWAYFDLVAAQGEVAIVLRNLSDAEGLLSMTEAFVAAGRASTAEVSRVNVIVATQQQSLVDARLKLALASSELIRIVRLDPSLLSSEALLYSADNHLLPIELVSDNSPLDSLIAQGQRSRPEVAEQYAIAQAGMADAKAQQLRPYIPNLNLGMSAGGFGGGLGSDLNGLDGRSDFDALLVWEIRNLGFGENAARNDSASRYRQAVLRSHQVQDQIAADVRNAWHKVAAGRERMKIAGDNVEEAARVLELNLDRIRGLEGLPLEAIQALNGVNTARLSYLRAVVDYNKAQAELLRAVGQPVATGV